MAPSPLINSHYFRQLFLQHDVSVATMEGGFSSALLFRVSIPNRAFVARQSGGYYGDDGFRSEMLISSFMAEHGVTPAVHYYDPTTLMSFSDYVHDLGFYNFYQRDKDAALKQMIALIKSVHKLEPQEFIKEKCILHDLTNAVNALPDYFLDDNLMLMFARACATPWPTDRVTVAHNDFQPNNILYDGKQLHLIDWEMAGLSHPFYDLACMANFLLFTHADGYELLFEYLGEKPSVEDKQIFNDLRRIGYGFLASINFLSAVGLPHAKKPTHHHIETETFGNIFSLWRQSIKEKDLNKSYRLGLFFAQRCATF